MARDFRGETCLMTEPRMISYVELETALVNLEWLIRNREGTFDVRSGTVVWGDGGSDVDSLLDENFTPASRSMKDT